MSLRDEKTASMLGVTFKEKIRRNENHRAFFGIYNFDDQGTKTWRLLKNVAN